jgi:phosphohistidine phosphatase SixA
LAAKSVEMRRHTDSDGDSLTPKGVEDAYGIGSGLSGPYEFAVSSGAQRATQTIACLLAGLGEKLSSGVFVDGRFQSEAEDRWRRAYERAGAGDLDSFRQADPELVEHEAQTLGEALRDVFLMLPAGGKALVVGHSPMQEAAVYGLTGQKVDPISKGAGVLVVERDEGGYEAVPLSP